MLLDLPQVVWSMNFTQWFSDLDNLLRTKGGLLCVALSSEAKQYGRNWCEKQVDRMLRFQRATL